MKEKIMIRRWNSSLSTDIKLLKQKSFDYNEQIKQIIFGWLLNTINNQICDVNLIFNHQLFMKYKLKRIETVFCKKFILQKLSFELSWYAIIWYM